MAVNTLRQKVSAASLMRQYVPAKPCHICISIFLCLVFSRLCLSLSPPLCVCVCDLFFLPRPGLTADGFADRDLMRFLLARDLDITKAMYMFISRLVSVRCFCPFSSVSSHFPIRNGKSRVKSMWKKKR